MKYQGFIGQTYQSRARNAECERLINWFPEVIESGVGKDSNTVYFKPTEGLELKFTVGTGPIRLVQYEGLGRNEDVILQAPILFVVSGSALYRCYYSAGSWTTAQIGSNFSTSTGQVYAASIKTYDASGSIYQTVFVDGENMYVYKSYSYKNDETFKSFSDASLTQVQDAFQIVWLDGYLILVTRNSNKFYVSEWAGTTFDGLDFASTEGSPDELSGMLVLGRNLLLFNERSLEVFVNTGNPDFPFERAGGGFSEKGCFNGDTIAKIESTAFWLGRDAQGAGCVYATQGITPQRISNHAIEKLISDYDYTTAKAYTYQREGHSFYVLNFSEGTIVFDATTRMWHERASLVNGSFTRFRAENLSYFPSLDMHLVGDFESGNVYHLNPEYFKEDTAPIRRERIAPHISNFKKRIFYDSLEVGLEVEPLSTGQGSDPQLMMQFSDDGGHTWSNEKYVSCGAIGEYKARAKYRRLGMARDRVFKVAFSEPIFCALIDAELEMSSE